MINIAIPITKTSFSHISLQLKIGVFESLIKNKVGASIVITFEHVEPTKLHMVNISFAESAANNTSKYRRNIIEYFPHLDKVIISAFPVKSSLVIFTSSFFFFVFFLFLLHC